jgi:regulator of sirC expression with transglutaminase-like and TPR domain
MIYQHPNCSHDILQESNHPDSLAILSHDVLEECVVAPFLDETSVLALSCCNHYYANMLLGQSKFAMKLWKKFCLDKWKNVTFQEEVMEGFYSSSDNENGNIVGRYCNGWTREYRRRLKMDCEAFTMMRDLADVENLDQGCIQYASFIRNGLDFMDVFQRRRHELRWRYDKMPDSIENGLVRFELCQKFQMVLDASTNNSVDSSASSGTLENGLILIAQYLFPALFPTAPPGNIPKSQVDLQSQVEQELETLAQILLRRLEQNSTYMSTSDDRIVLEEMKFLFDDNLSSNRPFSGNKEDYYTYHNSMIHTVLATRKGIPITLGIIYSAIVRRAVGMEMRPVNIPGHFMMAVKVREPGGRPGQAEQHELFIDAFHGGRILTAFEVERMIVSSYNVEWKSEYLLDHVSSISVWKRVAMNLLNCHDVTETSRILLLVLVSWVFGNQVRNIRSVKDLQQSQVKMLCCLSISE